MNWSGTRHKVTECGNLVSSRGNQLVVFAELFITSKERNIIAFSFFPFLCVANRPRMPLPLTKGRVCVSFFLSL